ncbi:MAG: hypothetical protein HGA42_16270 [Nostocales cyanobacterium W4_Combined_metabat2_030]|nr:hypothetical protein [Nostocales cyanobacterium W4_Combined_metabat2_030]
MTDNILLVRQGSTLLSKTRPALDTKEKMKLIRKLATVGAMCLVFAGVAGQAAQAQQRTTSLFSNTCVGRGSYGPQNQDISIGKQLFTSIYSLGGIYIGGNPIISSITCRIRPAGSAPRFKTLRLAFGIDEDFNSSFGGAINVYIDGNKAETRELYPGDKAFLLLDVSRVSNVAIEAVPISGKNLARVSFFQALLEPISASPGQR